MCTRIHEHDIRESQPRTQCLGLSVQARKVLGTRLRESEIFNRPDERVCQVRIPNCMPTGLILETLLHMIKIFW